MDYTHVFEISASGMDFQRQRLDIIASNVANSHTTRSNTGKLYQALDVVAFSDALANEYQSIDSNQLKGVERVEIVEKDLPPRLVFEPGHPDANADGYVTYPNVDAVDAMMSLMTATRAYEANARVMNAAKSMALKALEIGQS